ncbi:MAG: Cupredoxin family domain protein [Candidatus Peregrinibacteria bacterium GW2011_GWA2_47_7]|nr:MAG: Cupredoxin family domain protein [Candidatus Peregrinibacteria bacterium GW2011_GWA2_47_7]
MKQVLIITLTLIASIGFSWWAVSSGGGNRGNSQDPAQSVREENGVQIIHILARGGYSPRQIPAKAGKPTRIEVETKGTYDCSSSLMIPSLGYRKQLPPTGVTSLNIAPQPSGATLRGLCSMGMFSFEVIFS